MKSLTFANIHKQGEVVVETDLYEHNHFPEMLLMYDSNFIKFKKMPLVDVFKKAEEYLRAYHLKKGQKHVKFYFPQDERLSVEVADYLSQSGYEVGFMEMYKLDPKQFPLIAHNPLIQIERVSNENFDRFISLKQEIDSEFGEDFARQKGNIHRNNFANSQFAQYIAFYEGLPAGAVDVIISEETVEIDGLVILDHFQKKGIGSHIQRRIMDEFEDKTIILVADGEDTPREMYKRQNYQFVGFQYEALKVHKN